jgi:hypothetical protein
MIILKTAQFCFKIALVSAAALKPDIDAITRVEDPFNIGFSDSDGFEFSSVTDKKSKLIEKIKNSTLSNSVRKYLSLLLISQSKIFKNSSLKQSVQLIN